jgi:hypothetical protein
MPSETIHYAKINRKVWNTCQFRSLSQDARELFFYLTTCPHGNQLGIFVLRPGYALDDLQWGIKSERFNKGLEELLDRGLFKYDHQKQVVLDLEQVDKHPPDNPNQVAFCIKLINTLPKTELFLDLKELIQKLDKPFLKPLAERLAERLGKQEVKEEVKVKEETQGDQKRDQKPRAAFVQPALEEVISYCKERKNSVDVERWMNHYLSNGWMVGKNKMKDWKAAVRNWEGKDEPTIGSSGRPWLRKPGEELSLTAQRALDDIKELEQQRAGKKQATPDHSR